MAACGLSEHPGTEIATELGLCPYPELPATGRNPADLDDRLDALRINLSKRAQAWEAKLDGMGVPDYTTANDLGGAALTAYSHWNDPFRARPLLLKAIEAVNVAREIGGVYKLGLSLELGVIQKAYMPCLGDSLSNEDKTRIRDTNDWAADTILRSTDGYVGATIDYTNHFLVYLVAGLLLSEGLSKDEPDTRYDDRDRTARYYQKLDEWIEHTRDHGINEYDSAEYYGLALRALDAAYALPDGRPTGVNDKLRNIHRYYWTDIAANWFPGRESLAGPKSRTYEWETGRGSLDWHFYLMGWTDTPPTMRPNHMEVLLDAELRGNYRPGSRILQYRDEPAKLVRQWWGLRGDHGRDRTNYVTTRYAIGSSNNDSTWGMSAVVNNVPVVAEIGTNPKLPILYAIVDVNDNPYGYDVEDGHARARPAVAQFERDLLVTFVPEPREQTGKRSVATNIVFPVKLGPNTQVADVQHQGVSIKSDLSTPGYERPVRVNDVIGIDSGAGAVAFRVVKAETCLDQAQLAMQLRSEGAGIARGVARLVIYHVRKATALAPAMLRECQPKVVIVIVAGEYLENVQSRVGSFAVGFDTTASGQWRAKASLEPYSLEVVRSANHEIVARRKNGEELGSHQLWLNGADVTPGGF
jgi:hypothetical protein